MTHILQQEPPQHSTHLIVKKAIQRGDVIIFQYKKDLLLDNITEVSVDVTDAETEPGLMKGWCVVSWEDKALSAGI